MSVVYRISLHEQITATTRLIDDMKTVAAMLQGDSLAQRQTIHDINCLVAIRETLRQGYVPGPDDEKPSNVKTGPVIYGRDMAFPKRITLDVVRKSGGEAVSANRG